MEKIIFKQEEHYCEIRLNKPSKLNTLDEQLVHEFEVALDHYTNSGLDKCLVRAEGPKSFCAGGDVVSVVEGVKSGRPYDFFFGQEYALDQRLYQTKGLIAHAHGIVMGGGLGVLMGCETKILDPKCLLAMPEVTIGFFPDVGASYFLQNLPLSWRRFMTLTGARLSAYDFLELGLIDKLCPIGTSGEDVINKDKLDFLHQECLKANPTYKDDFLKKDAAIKEVGEFKELQEFEDFALKHSSDESQSWRSQSLKTYLHGSPVSKVLTWDYFNWCSGKPREACFEQDLKLAEIVSTKGDFSEGVRALLIDKDKNPHWQDDSLASCEDRLKEDRLRLFN